MAESNAIRFFAGLRSEPFLADVDGLLKNMQFTGTDFFAGKDVFSLAREVPNEVLGPGPAVGIWGRTSVRQDGQQVPIDRIGGPGVTNFLNQLPEEKKAYCEAEPSSDRENFASRFAATLQTASGYSVEEATAIVERTLPDLLRFDASSREGFPKGRQLPDDVIDLSIALVTHGTITGRRGGTARRLPVGVPVPRPSPSLGVIRVPQP